MNTDLRDHGFRDERGRPRAQLNASWAAEAAQSLHASGVKAVEAERLVNAVARAALEQGQVSLEHPLTTPAPSAVREWVGGCVAALRTPEDRQPLAAHLAATLRLLALVEATRAFNAARAR